MQLVAETGLSSLVFLVALMLVIGFLLLRSHRYFSRQERNWTPPGSSRPARPQATAPRPGPSKEQVQWEVQMHELARELSGQLDSKIGVLTHLVREAERAAARLEAALQAYERLGAAPTAGRPSALPEARPAESFAESEGGPPGQTEPLQAGSGRRAGPADNSRPSPGDRRYEEIYLLADYGFAPVEIARRVGMPIGEVELILSLRGKR